MKLFRISGDSMYPLLKEGDVVVGVRLGRLRLKEEDIVVFEHPPQGTMIKKVRAIENSSVFVEGTSPFSIDSRDFGAIPLSKISHKILFKLPFK